MRKFSVSVIALVMAMAMSYSYANGYKDVSNLKTLFTTPSERQKLNEMRNSGFYAKKDNSNNKISIFKEPLQVKVDGVLLRGNSAPVVWVNGKSTLKTNRIDEEIRVRKNRISEDNIKVPVKVMNKTLVMKPGQVWTESRPEVVEDYQTKAVKKPLDGVE
ncbi:MAG: hypothetical protein OQL09_00970 [Gammaproteobacteria bacterium]|nr:hypothetical protein [Gammaproteobacteria bacterium]